MAIIKQIKIGTTLHDIAATYDGNKNDISTTYLPLTGGTLTGQLTINTGTTQSSTKGIKWAAINSKNPYIGYATDQTDGTFVVSSLLGTSYASGLAISGGSGNLLYKGNRVLDSSNYSSYALSLSGGTMTGQIKKAGASSSWWNGRDNAFLRQTTADGYSPMLSIKTTNGSWEIGHYNYSEWHDQLLFNYKSDSSYANGGNANSVVHALKITSSGTLKATTFEGNLSGNASTATALTTSKGSATNPVYFSGGKPVACTYSLNKTVPSDAKFTDTTYDLSPYMRHHGLTNGGTPFNFDTQGGNWVLNVANSWSGSIPSGNYGWIGMMQFTGNHFYVQIAASVPNSSNNAPTAGGGGFFYRSRYTSQSFTSWARLDSRVYNEKGPAAGGYIVHSSEIGAFTPLNLDNTLDLGSTGNRWKNLYYRGSINPSDIRLKTDLKKISEDERYIKLFDLIEPYTYKFIDGTSGRTHTGFISQYVEQDLEEVGLDSSECALFCKEKKKQVIQDDQGTVIDIVDIYNENGELDYDYMLNYMEYIAITAAKIKALEKEYNQKFEDQEKRISELENLVLKLIENK